MRKILSTILAAVAALCLSVPAHAQTSDSYAAVQRLLDGESAAISESAVSTYTPIIIKWVGGAGGGTVAVAAGGDMTLSTGPAGGSAVETTVNTVASGSPCGATPGVLDLSTPLATCDTLGEVVNVINKSANWRAVVRDGLFADSSDNTLITLVEIAANGADGLALLGDHAVTFWTTKELSSEPVSIRRYIDGTRVAGIVQNPSAGSRVVLFQNYSKQTFAGGALSYQVFSCKDQYPVSWTGGVAQGVATETCTTLENQVGPATTVAQTWNYPWALESRKGERMVVRMLNSTTASTVIVWSAYGRVAPLK